MFQKGTPAAAASGVGCYFSSSSRLIMAAFFVLRELFAIFTCSSMATRSSFASLLSSDSACGVCGLVHRLRIRAQSSSIRGSVSDDTRDILLEVNSPFDTEHSVDSLGSQR